jgi:2-succinyl-6-hydroxy-2,4-cyclohexadiene-1-carboxylate synthase
MITTRRIDVGAVELAVDEAGAGGRPLLLVHGIAGGRDAFTPLVPALVAAGWHVVAPDNRGHGDSDHPPSEDDYSLEIFAADTLGLLDALGWDRAAVLGHSMGGAIVEELALAAPARVERLVLLDTTGAGVDSDPALLAAAAAVARTDGMARLVELMDEQGDPLGSPAAKRAEATIPGYRERGARTTLASSAAMFATMMDMFAAGEDRSPRLATLSCPTLVAVGDEDTMMLGPSHRLAEAIPGARLVVIPDAGHNPNFENTDALLAVLLDFLGTGATASGP